MIIYFSYGIKHSKIGFKIQEIEKDRLTKPNAFQRFKTRIRTASTRSRYDSCAVSDDQV